MRFLLRILSVLSCHSVLILRIQREIVARKIRALRLMQAEPASAPVFGIPAQ